MPDLRLAFAAVRGEFAKAFAAISRPIASASTAAAKDAASQIKSEGRSRIAAAGFSQRWQNALRTNVYPKSGMSINAAIYAWHKIPYANIFQDGGKIQGSPWLWLPLPNIPAISGGRKMTPKTFQQTIAPLYLIKVPGKKPFLGAYVSLGSDEKRLTAAKFRAGARRRNLRGILSVKLVPVFFAVNSVDIKAKFNLRQVFERARNSLGKFYVSHLKGQ